MKKALLWSLVLVGAILACLYLSYRFDTKAPDAKVDLPPVQYEDPQPIAETPDGRVVLLRKYFTDHGMPLAMYAGDFVRISDNYDLDYRLLPAISVRESSGGLHACGLNMWGWNSCKVLFAGIHSIPDGIDYIASRLTFSPYYKGKNLTQKLSVYNSVVPHYADQVIAIMQMIEND